MNDHDVGTNFRDWKTDEELAHFMGAFDLPRVGDRIDVEGFAEDGDTKVAHVGQVMEVEWTFRILSGSTPLIGRCVYIRKDPEKLKVSP